MVRRDHPVMSSGQQVRRLWKTFQDWLKGPKAAMEQNWDTKLSQMDAKWNSTPAVLRIPRDEHQKLRRALRTGLVDQFSATVQLEWQRRLEEAGLRDEDWGTMSSKEMEAVEQALMVGKHDLPSARTTTATATATTHHDFTSLPSPTSTNSSSSFTFVHPSSFVDDDYELETGIQDLGALASVRLESALQFSLPHPLTFVRFNVQTFLMTC